MGAMMKRCGTPGYIPPEVIERSQCSFPADIFALGVTLYLLVTCEHPFRGKSMQSIMHRTVKHEPEYHAGTWQGINGCMSFVKALLKKDPTQRLSMEEAMRHPWLQNFNAKIIERSDSTLTSTNPSHSLHNVRCVSPSCEF